MASPLLEGTWSQPCQNASLNQEAFSGNQVTLTENHFEDAQCQRGVLIFSDKGTYVVNGRHMDFSFTQVSITLQIQTLVDDFNQRQVCGFQDWQLGQEKAITGLKCALFTNTQSVQVPAVGDQRFGIYKIDEEKEGDRLFLGRLTPGHDALSPEKRPLEFDPQFYLRQ